MILQVIAKKCPRVFSGLWFAVAGFLASLLAFLIMGGGALYGSWIPFLLSAGIAFGTGNLIASPIIKDPTITFSKAIYLGIFAGVAAQFVFILIGLSYEFNRNDGSLEQLLMSPMKILELLFIIMMSLINPFALIPVAIMGGLAGMSLYKVVKL